MPTDAIMRQNKTPPVLPSKDFASENPEGATLAIHVRCHPLAEGYLPLRDHQGITWEATPRV